jgi:hypothetical protein
MHIPEEEKTAGMTASFIASNISLSTQGPQSDGTIDERENIERGSEHVLRDPFLWVVDEPGSRLSADVHALLAPSYSDILTHIMEV